MKRGMIPHSITDTGAASYHPDIPYRFKDASGPNYTAETLGFSDMAGANYQTEPILKGLVECFLRR